MPNNRNEIFETLIKGPEIITGNKLFKMLKVEDGTNAVITLNGKYVNTVQPGGHLLGRYRSLTECKVYIVDMKDRKLEVATQGELIIQKPAPMPIDLSASISYRVIKPEIVALRIDRPLTTLYDYVLEAMREAVNHLGFEDFMLGTKIASFILKHLQDRDVGKYLGLEILTVQVLELHPNERMRQVFEDKIVSIQEEKLKNEIEDIMLDGDLEREKKRIRTKIAIAKELGVDPVHLIMPDQSERILISPKERLEKLIELARIGLIKPEDLIRESIGLSNALRSELHPNPLSPDKQERYLPQIASDETSSSVADRVIQERKQLEDQGYKVDVERYPQGYFGLIVQPTQPREHSIKMHFVVTSAYPIKHPYLMVELDGERKEFKPDIFKKWTRHNTVLDIVEVSYSFFCI